MQKRAEETRERILAAALTCFSARGFHGARVDEIAAKARTNKERIYSNFKDKEGLYAEVIRRAFAEIAEEEARVARALDGRTDDLPAELIEHYLTRTSGVNLRDPKVRRKLLKACLWSAPL